MEHFNGYEYIKIDIANQFGLDKWKWEDRIKWVEDNRNDLDTLVDDADKPLLFIKAVKALKDAEDKIPTGFIMGLDSTASGIQIMAALIGCHKTAANVNLIDTGERNDLYTKIANHMTVVCGKVINREEVKYPVMTTFYCSTKQPEEAFGEDTPELKAFYEVLAEELPGAMEMLADIQGCWDTNALKHEWTLPDGHVASVKVMVSVNKKIEVDELDHATFTHRAEVNESDEYGLSLPANVIHSIDGYIVREMLRMARLQGFELLTIHDSFWSSPNYMQNVRKNYATILADIADSDLIKNILDEITGEKEPFTKYSTDLGNEIRTSEYALS